MGPTQHLELCLTGSHQCRNRHEHSSGLFDSVGINFSITIVKRFCTETWRPIQDKWRNRLAIKDEAFIPACTGQHLTEAPTKAYQHTMQKALAGILHADWPGADVRPSSCGPDCNKHHHVIAFIPHTGLYELVAGVSVQSLSPFFFASYGI